jgi:hypothetical protein
MENTVDNTFENNGEYMIIVANLLKITEQNKHQIFEEIYDILRNNNYFDIIKIIKNFNGEIDGITISNLLFLLKDNYNNEIIDNILNKITNINFNEYSYILYTVKNFNDEIKLKIFNELNKKINNFNFIDIKNIKNLFLSLKNIKLDIYFLNKLKIFDYIIENIEKKQNELTPTIISSIFNSLININYKNKKVKKLLVLLSNNIKENDKYKMNNIIDIFEGISNMYSTEEEVRYVLKKLYLILLNNTIYWNSCKITKIFSYLKNMSNYYEEVDNIINILTNNIKDDFYNIRDISYSIQGLKSMFYNHNIEKLLMKFNNKIINNYYIDNINFIANIFSGLIGMNNSNEQVIILFNILYDKLETLKNKNISFLDISTILYGCQNMINDNEIVNNLLKLITEICNNDKMENLKNNCIQLLGKALYGLLNMNFDENIKNLLDAIFKKINIVELFNDYINSEYSTYTISQLYLFLYKFEFLDIDILKKINQIIFNLEKYTKLFKNSQFSSCFEKNIFTILKDKYDIKNNVIIDGFELDILIEINGIKINVEIDGPIHNYPKKQLFNKYKKEYLENKNIIILSFNDDNCLRDLENKLITIINIKIKLLNNVKKYYDKNNFPSIKKKILYVYDN